MFKKGLLALTLVFSLPVFAAEHWIDVRVPEQYQQEHCLLYTSSSPLVCFPLVIKA